LLRQESSPFIGREHELAFLTERLGAAQRGEGGVVLVGGEPGVGKTRFVMQVALRAKTEGWRVLIGSAYDTDGMPSYLPFIEALQSYVRTCPVEELRVQLGDGAADVAMLVRDVRRVLPEVAADVASPSPNERYHLFESICQFLLAIAGASPPGLLLCLDDLHWADPSTLLLCQHLARKLSSDRVLVLAAYRDEEVDRTPALLDLLAEIAHGSLGHRITLSRLNVEETTALAADLAGVTPARPVAQAIFDQTQGNAFFAGEVIRQLRDSGGDLADSRLVRTDWSITEGVRHVIGKRLLHLESETRQLLEAASVLGERFSLELLSTSAALATTALVSALEEATKAGMLQEEAIGYKFGHPLIRRVIYEQLSLPRRRSLHLAAGEATESNFSEDIEPHLSVLAYHFHIGAAPGNYAKVLDYATRAGDRAIEVFAYEEAARMYQIAIEALQSERSTSGADILADLHLKRARAFGAITMWAEARRALESALPLLSVDRQTERAELFTDLAIACLWTNETTRGQQYAAAAKALAEGLAEDILTGAIAATARLQFSDGAIQASRESYQDAINRSRGARISRLDQLLPAHAHLLYLTGNYPAAIDQALKCIDVSREVNDFSSLVYALGDLGLSLAASGRYDDGLQALDEAQSAGREYGLTTFLARACGMRAGPYLDLSDYRQAEQLAEEALDVGRSFDFESTVVSAGIDLLLCHSQTGEVGKAEVLLREVVEDAAAAADIHGWLWKLRLAQARAQIALARHQWREAMDIASESSELSRAKRRTKYEVAASMTRGQALLGLGRKGDALKELRHAVQIARPVGDPAMLLRASAAVLSIEPDAILASEAHTAVDSILKSLSHAEMRRTLEESEPVRLVLSFQKSRGGASASRVSTYPKALSDRKIEVFRLIVQGKTNREIAAALVLSERTVQRHIADLYREIDVRNRAEATAFGINQLGLPSV
jgi:DNA-binding NarL/FixJ family response regulator